MLETFVATPIGLMKVIIDQGALQSCNWTGNDDIGKESLMKGIEEDDLKVLTDFKEQIKDYFDGRRKTFSLSLSPQGTPFQRRVWEEIGKVRYGEVITYGELARRADNPKATRAVAGACGANPIPIIVPCHRIVAAGKRIGGYTGGLENKRSLLELEARNATDSLFHQPSTSIKKF